MWQYTGISPSLVGVHELRKRKYFIKILQVILICAFAKNSAIYLLHSAHTNSKIVYANLDSFVLGPICPKTIE